ncbi:MAG: MotA/TolQ/ExbB proton channel family protein [Myxococcus sp.]|nr:MotA/TolQ/ExbB proton channel family protein [Myxococcus sp.]
MFDFGKILGHMGVPAMSVAAVLLLMALASLAVFFERLVAYARSRSATRRFALEAKALLDADQPDELARKADVERHSHLAKLLGTGARTYLSAAKKGGSVAPIELTRRELERKTELLAADVRRGMGVLASVGSVAPFVGLLGTVFGIITAFQGIAKEGAGGLGSVSLGIAEALVETAFGLMVAIPAVLAFNWLSTQADGIMLALDDARGEFIDFLEARHGAPREPSHGE